MSRESPPPGWYTDTTGERMQWWDGERWTEHYRDPAPPEGHEPERPHSYLDGMALAGYVAALLLPPLGLGIAAALMNRDNPHGTWVGLISLVIGVLWIWALVSLQETLETV